MNTIFGIEGDFMDADTLRSALKNRNEELKSQLAMEDEMIAKGINLGEQIYKKHSYDFKVDTEVAHAYEKALEIMFPENGYTGIFKSLTRNVLLLMELGYQKPEHAQAVYIHNGGGDEPQTIYMALLEEDELLELKEFDWETAQCRLIEKTELPAHVHDAFETYIASNQ